MPFVETPEFQSGILPFLIGLVGTIILAAVARLRGVGWVSIVLPVGYLLTYWAVEGIPGFLPVASKQKVFYLVLLAGVLAMLLHAMGASRRFVIGAGVIWSAVALVWLTERQIASADASLIITLIVLLLLSALILFLLSGEQEGAGALQPGAALLVAGFAAGIVSLQGAFIGMAQLSIAIGALLGGYLLVAFGIFLRSGGTFRFGPLGALGLGAAWLAGVYVMVLFADRVNRWALLLVAASFLLMPLASRLRSTRPGALGRAVQVILFGAIVAIPSIGAAIWVLATGTADSGY